jgi:uncharacterized protein (TIRG00374 family)
VPTLFSSGIDSHPAKLGWNAKPLSVSREVPLNPPHSKTPFLIFLFAAGLMVLALATALLSDFSKLRDAFRQVEISPLFFALLSTGAAYLSSAFSFRAVFNMTPYRVPFPKFFSIMFISDTMNFIISSGGMSSIAIRAFILKREKVPYSVTVPLSLAQNMVFNLVLACACLGGLGYLRGHPEFTGGPKRAALLFFMAGLLAVVAGMMAVFLDRGFRRWLMRQLLRTGHWVHRRILRGKTRVRALVEIRNELEATVAVLRRGRARLLLVFFWVLVDWGFMALALYFCFRAAGVALPPGLLLVGFTVMFLSSNINPVPAGLGVSETLLAFTFKLLGVGFEKTLVAALLFRLVYYLVPLAVSTALFLDKMRPFLKNRQGEVL